MWGGAWILPDGKYSFDVYAEDAAKRRSGTSSVTLEIDNTPPVLLLSKPLGTGEKDKDDANDDEDTGNATSFGRILKLTGDVSDDHDISQLNLYVYEKEGKVTNKIYKKDPVKIEVKNFSAMSVDSPLVVANYYTLDEIKNAGMDTEMIELRERYLNIYNGGFDVEEKDYKNKKYFTRVELVDEARIYRNIGDNGSGIGNATEHYYIVSDDLYDSLMSENTYSLTAKKLYGIMSGSGTDYSDEEKSTILSIINSESSGYRLNSRPTDIEEEQAIDITKSNEIILNPDNAPTWEISGWKLNTEDYPTTSGYRPYVSGTMSVSISAGRDQYPIRQDTVKIRIRDVTDGDRSATGKKYPEVTKENEKDYKITIPETDVSMLIPIDMEQFHPELDRKYEIEIDAEDRNGNRLKAKTKHGFYADSNKEKPTVIFTDEEYKALPDVDVYKSAAGTKQFTLYGIAHPYLVNLSNNVNDATVSVKVVNTQDSKELDFKPACSAVQLVTYDEGMDNRFTVIIGNSEDYVNIVPKTPGKYKYTVEVKVKDESGLEGSNLFSFYVDTEPPTVNINSVTPRVDDGASTYVNGTFTVSARARDNNELSEVWYYAYENDLTKAFQSGKCESAVSPVAEIKTRDEDGNLKITDGEKITVLFKAIDSVGNEGTTTTTIYNEKKSFIVSQESDKPKIKYNNVNPSIQSKDEIKAAYIQSQTNPETLYNIFDNTNNRNITATITDDDGIAKVEVGYKLNGNTGDYTWVKTISPGGTTSYTLNYQLPDDFGLYDIKVRVTDTENTSKYNITESEFTVAVDDGAPKIKIITTSGQYFMANKNDREVIGTVSDVSGVDSITSDNGTVDGTTNWTNIFSTGSTSGTYTIKYIATDVYGQSSEEIYTYNVDAEPPVLKDESPDPVDSTKPYYPVIFGNGDDRKEHSKFKTATGAYYGSNTIALEGYFADKTGGSGIKKVNYTVWGNDPDSSDPTKPDPTKSARILSETSSNATYVKTVNSEDLYSFSTILSLETGVLNNIHITAEDNAGNVSTNLRFTDDIRIDTQLPLVGPFTYKGVAAADVLTNGKSPVVIGVTASDDNGIDKIEFIIGNNVVASKQFDNTTVMHKSVENEPIEIPVDKLPSGTNQIKVTVTDVAGNNISTTASTLQIDKNHPTYTITSAKEKLNGVTDITGTAKDAESLDSLELYYAKAVNNPSDTTPTTGTLDVKTILESAGWKKIEKTFDRSEIYNWTYENFDWADNSDAMANDGKATIYLLPVVTDMAGNSNAYTVSYDSASGKTTYKWDLTSAATSVGIDLHADRPVIKFSNLELSSMSDSSAIWLKNTRTLIGTISDDDGDVTSLKYIIKTGTGMTTAPSASDWSSAVAKSAEVVNGSWSIDADEGEQIIYFQVVDGAGGTFTSATATGLKAVKFRDSKNTEFNAYTRLHLKIALNNPELAPDAVYNGETNLGTAYSTIKLGGTTDKITLRVKAKDANGIDTVKAMMGKSGAIDASNSSTYTEYTAAKNDALTTSDSNGYTWYEFKNIDCSTGDGMIDFQATATSKSGMSTKQTINFVLDNTAPVVEVTTPSLSTSVTEPVTAMGIVDSTSTVYYTISTDGTTKPSEATSITKWEGANGESGTISNIVSKEIFPYKQIKDAGLSWRVIFTGPNPSATGTYGETFREYIKAYGITTEEKLNAKDNTKFETIVKLYLWIKAVDECGNVSEKSHQILYDPQGDRPTITIDYPESKGGVIPTVGGAVRLSGAVNDPAGQILGVKSVWVQLISGNKHTNNADLTNFTLQKEDLDFWKEKYGDVVYKMSTYNSTTGTGTKWSGSLGSGESFSDYAILASFTPNGSSWSLRVNGSNELNPINDGEQNQVAIRTYAIDGDGKMSLAANTMMKVDKGSPIVSDLYIVQSASADLTGTVTASKEYKDDMYVKGEWYLVGTVTDDAIKTLKIEYADTTTNLILESSIVSGAKVSLENSSTNKIAKFRCAIPYKDVGKTEFTIFAEDDANHYTSQTISINHDNEAPVLAATTDSAYKINADVHQSNGFYTFSSKVNEDAMAGGNQSGLSHLAFYFVRTVTGGKKIYNPLLKTSAEGNATSISGLHNELGLYWITKTVTRDINNLNVLTLTGDWNSNIHKNGLVLIGGSTYLILGVDSASKIITLDGNPDASFTTAYIALASIVDNTVAETGTGNKADDGYYEAPANDDGDRMVEFVDKQGTTYYWEASINSQNIPDGPIELHYVAFDKAGNYSAGTATGAVKNNAPRIVGVSLGTDYNGDGTLYASGTTKDTIEWVTKHSELYSDLLTGTTYDYEKLAKDTASSDRTLGTETDPIIKFKGYSEIEIELVGGNGALNYKYSLPAGTGGTALSGNNSTVKLADGKTDYTGQKTIIKIQPGDLVKLGDYKNQKMTFEVWDSTESTTQFSNSSYARLNVWAGVEMADGKAPEAKIKPFYWNSLKDNSIYGSNSDSVTSVSDLQGHIELEGDLPDTLKDAVATGSTKFGGDPKVSGKIVIKGTASDNKRLKNLYIKVPGMTFSGNLDDNSTAIAQKDSTGFYLMATHKSGGWVSTGNRLSDGFIFEVSNERFTSEGHFVDWTFTWDTSKISTVAALDVAVQVMAEDEGKPAYTSYANGTGASADAVTSIDGTTKYSKNPTGNSNNKTSTGSYQMDVVPYIKKISRQSKYNTYRARSGAVPLLRGEADNVLEGFNIANVSNSSLKITSDKTGGTQVAAISSPAFADGKVTFTVPATAKDGYLHLVVNGVPALNNMNAYKEYNTETTTKLYDRNKLSDDRYVHIWRVTPQDTFKGSKNGVYPAMSKSSDGTLYASYNNYSASRVYYTNKFVGDTDVTIPDDKDTTLDVDGYMSVYKGFDPAEETDIVVNGTDVNVFYAANYQSGGGAAKWNGTAPGDAGGIFVYENKAPGFDVSSYSTKSFRFELYTYDNELGQFKNIRVTRNTDNVIYVTYYDRLTNSIKVSWVNNNGDFTAHVTIYPQVGTRMVKINDTIYNYTNKYITYKGSEYKLTSRDSNKTTYNGVDVYTYIVDGLTFDNSTSFESDILNNTTSTKVSGLPWINLDGGYDETDFSPYTNTADSSPANFIFAGGWSPALALDKNYENELKRTSGTGEIPIITTTKEGYPVVVYMDAASGNLRLARSDSLTPYGAEYWHIQSVLSSSDPNNGLASDYVSAIVDDDGYLHIVFQNTRGELVYVKSTNTSADGKTAYTFGPSIIIDDSAMWTDFAVNGTTPYISYVSRVNSYDGMKIAYWDSTGDFNNDGVAEGGWETMTAPLNVKITNNRTCIETQAKAYDYNAANDNKYTAAIGFCPGSDYRAAFFVGK